MNPLVSIITPSYNAQEYIEETIISVMEQSYQNWELIIIDDKSSDKSASIIKDFMQKDERIKYIQNTKNIGAAQSRNRGMMEAKGEYISFLDADDTWLPLKLEKQIHLMQKENILLSYTAYHTVNVKGDVLGLFCVPHQVTYSDMLKTSVIGTLTTIYNAKILGKFYFEEIGHEDYVLKLQILKKIPYAIGINEALAKYRMHSKSLSSNKLHAALWQWKIYRKTEKLSFVKSIYYFMHYTYNGVIKYR